LRFRGATDPPSPPPAAARQQSAWPASPAVLPLEPATASPFRA
jgi:hypothetical protein